MRPLLAAVLSLALAAHAAEPARAPAPADGPAASPLRERLTDDAIRRAVRETLAESGDGARSGPSGKVLSGGAYQAFSREFSEAKKPSCLGPDALKFQPAEIGIKGFAVNAGGLLALPFWAAAIARGKCR